MADVSMWRCPYCKGNTVKGSDDKEKVKAVHLRKRRVKRKGGRFTDYYIGICTACGVVYSYKVLESSIFEEQSEEKE